LHRVTNSWGEGGSHAGGEEGGGITAQTGDATWAFRFFNTQRWTTPGGDFVAAPSATTNVSTVGFYSWSSPQLIADVQQWVDSPSQNFGWLIRGAESSSGSAKRFDSRQNGTPANRPVLEITYEMAAGAPLTVESVEVNAGIADPAVPDQPTSWELQRSDIRAVVVTFSEDIQPVTAADLQLTNLGVNAPADPDTPIALDDSQLSQNGNVLTISFDPFQLPDGVYSLDILPSVSTMGGNGLDGDGDGTAGDPYHFVGDTTNRFHKLVANFNGDTGVTIFDFPTFQFWFNRQQPPSYVDLNPDGLVTIFDFPAFSENFLAAVILPPTGGLQSALPAHGGSTDFAPLIVAERISSQRVEAVAPPVADATARHRLDDALWRDYPWRQSDSPGEDTVEEIALDVLNVIEA
jgi:hypothetical protein